MEAILPFAAAHAGPWRHHTGADYSRCSGAAAPYGYQQDASGPEAWRHAAGQRLLAAAARGEATEVLLALGDGGHPDSREPGSLQTGLHVAGRGCSMSVLELLLRAGADPNARDAAGRTPLFEAARAGFLPAVRLLLQHGAALWPVSAAGQDSDGSGSACDTGDGAQEHDAGDARFLALRSTCAVCAAAAAACWPVVAALLAAVPPDYHACPAALSSLRYLVWALVCHKAFPRDVIARLPPRLPACVVNAVRPAHLASTPLVLATGNDQQELMQWLLQRGADPELGAPLLLCAGRFCRGSRTCCVNCLLRLGARPHVAWHDRPQDSPLLLAARGDCFTHVHCLVAHGADVGGEAERVRATLMSPAAWELALPALEATHGALAADSAATQPCPCGVQHASWPGMWPADMEDEGDEGQDVMQEDANEDGGGSADGCSNTRTSVDSGSGSRPSSSANDSQWYRQHLPMLVQLQEAVELAACCTAVSDMWHFGCAAVQAEMGAEAAEPPAPQMVLAALQDVGGGWLAAALRCRQQRLLRLALYDDAVAAGRLLLQRKRAAALAGLAGFGLGLDARGGCVDAPAAAAAAGAAHSHAGEPLAAVVGSGHDIAMTDAGEGQPAWEGRRQAPGLAHEQPVALPVIPIELKMEILIAAGLAPPAVVAQVGLAKAARGAGCGCKGCSADRRRSADGGGSSSV